MSTDIADYCRRLERYLCQKNEGHLIRIVGPAFERVKAWAEQGVPLKIACHGIDRYCERYLAKGPRRRPVRIEFCEADILDVFDDWRRAVGVAASPEAASSPSKKPGLASHVERAMNRLTALGQSGRSASFDREIDRIVRALGDVLEPSRHARGDARASIVARLAELDRDLARAATGDIDEASRSQLQREAESEVAPFAGRMAADARAAAVDAAFERLVRETLRLPVIAYM